MTERQKRGRRSKAKGRSITYGEEEAVLVLLHAVGAVAGHCDRCFCFEKVG